MVRKASKRFPTCPVPEPGSIPESQPRRRSHPGMSPLPALLPSATSARAAASHRGSLAKPLPGNASPETRLPQLPNNNTHGRGRRVTASPAGNPWKQGSGPGFRDPALRRRQEETKAGSERTEAAGEAQTTLQRLPPAQARPGPRGASRSSR